MAPEIALNRYSVLVHYLPDIGMELTPSLLL